VLHSSIFYSYVCKAKNNVREGISLKKVLCICNQTKNLQSNRNKKTSSGNKTRSKNRKQKQFENKPQSHENEQCSENGKQTNQKNNLLSFD